MDLKEIQNLLKFVEKLEEINEVKLEMEGIKITVKRASDKKEVSYIAPMPQQVVIPQQQMQTPVTQPVAQLPEEVKSVEDTSKYIEVKSPMIGTFYRRPSPDKPLFVEVGTSIKVGQTLCIIEAMKLFNEIESEVSGKIVKILVDDASPVEYGQPLFLVEPA